VTSKTKKKKHPEGPKGHHRTYTIQSGDTLGSIASKIGTTIARLEQLNPGIDPTALHVGQTIRVQ
jgi:N-acetylmuramoyl-L-alanine amidase